MYKTSKEIFKDGKRVTVTAELPESIYQAILEMYDLSIIQGLHNFSLEEFLGVMISGGLILSLPEWKKKELGLEGHHD